jgi:hypothetical protein
MYVTLAVVPSVWHEPEATEDGSRHKTKQQTTDPVRHGALGPSSNLLRDL